MKQIISILVVIIFSGFINAYAHKRYSLLEEYYTIDTVGKMDTLIIKETRSYRFNHNEFISGQASVNGMVLRLDSYVDEYNSLLKVDKYNSSIERDEQGRIATQQYVKNKNTYTHYYSYNLWGDVTQDELVTSSGDTTIFSYEYFYLPEFTYATNDNGVTAISGYGNDYESLWLRRTVKRDDRIIESANRKISHQDNSFFLKSCKKLLTAIGYGPTVK